MVKKMVKGPRKQKTAEFWNELDEDWNDFEEEDDDDNDGEWEEYSKEEAY